MNNKRREFLKKSCFSGLCLCAAKSLASAASGSDSTANSLNNPETKTPLPQSWIAALLQSMDSNLNESQRRKVIKACAKAHYQDLKMDEILLGYIGKQAEFVTFLTEKWGWRVEVDTTYNTIVADENKDYCVCPLVDKTQEDALKSLCYCSEGFAEAMFSKILEKQVQATVVSSILRGGKTCVYKIEI